MSTAKKLDERTTAPTEYVPPELPPGIVKAFGVFKKHFPDLLAKHYGRIAACDGERVLYIGDDQQKLYTKCLKRGLKEGEFIVVWIVPDATDYMN